jgi:hypothetical protein
MLYVEARPSHPSTLCVPFLHIQLPFPIHPSSQTRSRRDKTKPVFSPRHLRLFLVIRSVERRKKKKSVEWGRAFRVGVLIEGLRCRCVKFISSIVSFQRKAKETEKQSRWFIVKPREFLPNADNLKEILRCRIDRQVFAIRNDELLICWAKARVEG